MMLGIKLQSEEGFRSTLEAFMADMVLPFWGRKWRFAAKG
jgi:hypothetical protein